MFNKGSISCAIKNFTSYLEGKAGYALGYSSYLFIILHQLPHSSRSRTSSDIPFSRKPSLVPRLCGAPLPGPPRSLVSPTPSLRTLSSPSGIGVVSWSLLCLQHYPNGYLLSERVKLKCKRRKTYPWGPTRGEGGTLENLPRPLLLQIIKAVIPILWNRRPSL